jgi:hypothetical protein
LSKLFETVIVTKVYLTFNGEGMKKILSITLITVLFSASVSAEKFKRKQLRKISSDDLVSKITKSEKEITLKLNQVINAVKPAKLQDGSPNYEATGKKIKQAIGEILVIAKANPDSDVAQLYKAAAEHIPLFKGFIYRLRRVAEVSDMTYISAIWALKQFKQTSSFRAPYMEALFDLATMPNPKENIHGQVGMFTNVSELQDWMVNVIAPKFTKTIDAMKKIAYKSGSGTHPIALINAELLVGEVIAQKYEPSKHSHKEWILTSGHLIGLVSGLENYMGLMYYLSSYNMEKLAELSNILTKETFIAVKGPASRSEIFSKSSARVDLLSTKRVYELTHPASGLFGKNSKGKENRGDYKNFMTIRPIAKQKVKGTDFPNRLKAAQSFFVMAANDQLQYHNAMMDTYGMTGEDKLMINPASYKATLDLTPYINQEEILRKSIDVLEANGPVNLEDHFIKKEYTIDISILFDVKKVNDLRAFLPNKFLDSLKERNPSEPKGWNLLSKNVKEWKKSYSWNYSFNKATQWKDPSFGGLLPNVNSERQGDELSLHYINVGSLPEIPYVGAWLSMFYGY